MYLERLLGALWWVKRLMEGFPIPCWAHLLGFNLRNMFRRDFVQIGPEKS